MEMITQEIRDELNKNPQFIALDRFFTHITADFKNDKITEEQAKKIIPFMLKAIYRTSTKPQ